MADTAIFNRALLLKAAIDYENMAMLMRAVENSKTAGPLPQSQFVDVDQSRLG